MGNQTGYSDGHVQLTTRHRRLRRPARRRLWSTRRRARRPRAPLPAPPELRPVRRAYALMARDSESSCSLAGKVCVLVSGPRVFGAARGCSGSSQFLM